MEKDRKKTIEETLQSFGVGVSDMNEKVGKTLTLYQFKPDMGVRISKIRNLKDEIAVALGVKSVRIIAPMDNGTVGIEVPNKAREIVHVSDLLNSWEYQNTAMELPCAIGRTVTNEIFMADLANMPHLLVAGATGQGKSVGLNVMLMSLLNKKKPDEIKLVLIDPKKVEMSAFEAVARPYIARLEGLPAIITEAGHAQMMLDALCRLMDKRYTMLQEAGVRNIKEYNEKSGKRMEYYVIVIDEYGDLVMQSGRQMELLICRLAQKARAVGMHMIISTQRPAATIVTGNIKANFPTRIAFRTTTGTDSRVILDQVGAERLTGNGDMIFFSGAELTRVQCAYVSTDEVLRCCHAIGMMYGGCRPKVIRAIMPNRPLTDEEFDRWFRSIPPGDELELRRYQKARFGVEFGNIFSKRH